MKAPSEDLQNDDEAWLAALAGRETPGGRPEMRSETRLEASLLRAAARRHAARPKPAVTSGEEQRLASALATVAARARQHAESQSSAATPRGRAAGLCSGCAARWQRLRDAWARLPRGAMAGGGLVLVVPALLWWLPITGERPVVDPAQTLRGAEPSGTAVIQRTDAERHRNALAQRLAAQGAAVQRYQRLGRYGLEAQFPLPLPTPLPPALQQALQADGLAVSNEGLLSVEFAAPRP